MEDRIDVLDLSVTSGDHAVGIEPFIAERIEVIKGSSTLLYGSGAIGGVVDVHTGRIPHYLPENGLTGGIETRFNDNTHGNTTAVKLNGGSGHFAWHLDGTLKDGDDYNIPGFTESGRLRALEANIAADPADAEHEVRGFLPGSFFDSESTAAGASYLADWGFVGLSVSSLDAEYGLPGGHEHEESDTAITDSDSNSTPSLELKQTRTDFELGVKDPFGDFSSLNIRAGFNNYEHQEIEPSGEVATDFDNQAWETRLELVHEGKLWTSVFGVQHSQREFSAIGEEAFIPPVDTQESGVFWIAERSFEGFDIEAGVRAGQLDHDPDIGSDEKFSTVSASLGVVIPFNDRWQLGLNVDHSSRGPVAEELYSNGPHLVTNTFELGNSSLTNEEATNYSATLQYQHEIWSATMTSYYTQFSDFIYQQSTGQILDDLPVVAYQQDDVTFYGVDMNLDIKIAEWKSGEIHLKGIFDTVSAELDVSGNDHLPRTPPTRYGLGLESQWGQLSGSINYLRVKKQSNITGLELATDAYNDLTVNLEYELPVSSKATLSVFLQGKNLTDDEQRIHTSFIKDFAPAPGRAIESGIRLSF